MSRRRRAPPSVVFAAAVSIVGVAILLATGIVIARGETRQEYRDYLAIAQSIVTMALGAAAIGLGYHYFDQRNRIESRNARLERRRRRLEHLLDQIECIDHDMDRLFVREWKTQQELDGLRRAVIRRFEYIQIFVSHREHLLGLGEKELQPIVALYSFVEKNDLLLRNSAESLSRADLTRVEDDYSDLLSAAKSVCVISIEKPARSLQN